MILNVKCIKDFSERLFLGEQDIVFYSGYIKKIDLEKESVGETEIIKCYHKKIKGIKGIVVIRCISYLLGRRYQSALVFNNGKFISIIDRVQLSNNIDGTKNLVVFEKNNKKIVFVLGLDVKNNQLMQIIALQKVDFIVNICYNAKQVNEYLLKYEKSLKPVIIQARTNGLTCLNAGVVEPTKSIVVKSRTKKNSC